MTEPATHMAIPGLESPCLEYERIGNATIFLGDCLDVLPYLALRDLADRPADLLIADPPYGITDCDWDVPIDLAAFWPLARAVCKRNAAHCVFCQMPFAATLYQSNSKMFRYDLVYRKRQPVGFLNSARMPLRGHELIYVFYERLPVYNAQLRPGKPYSRRGHTVALNSCYVGKRKNDKRNTGHRHPTSVLEPPLDRELLDGAINKAAGLNNKRHNTQKNVHALAFLIRSYSHAGDMVLDPCMGTGSTGVAALRCGRHFIGIEKERRFFDMACDRLARALALGEDLLAEAGGQPPEL